MVIIKTGVAVGVGGGSQASDRGKKEGKKEEEEGAIKLGPLRRLASPLPLAHRCRLFSFFFPSAAF